MRTSYNSETLIILNAQAFHFSRIQSQINLAMDLTEKLQENQGHEQDHVGPPDVMADKIKGVDKSTEGKNGDPHSPSLEGTNILGSKADVSPAKSSPDGYVAVTVVQVLGILIEEETKKHDARRVSEALRDLADFLYCDGDMKKADKNKQEAQSQGACTLLIQAMNTFEADKDVQVYGCRCIGALFYSHYGIQVAENICLQIFQSRGIELTECIAMAAKNFPGCPRAQTACYGALINLLAHRPLRCLSPAFGAGIFGSHGQDSNPPLDEGMWKHSHLSF